MKNTTNAYGWLVIALLVLAIIILLASPFATTIGDNVGANVQDIQDKAAYILENIKDEDFFGRDKNYTYYTPEKILALGDRATTVGKNDPLYIVGIYSEDFSEVVLSRNGKDSDGIMSADAFSNRETLYSVAIKSGVLNVADGAFQGCNNLNSVFLAEGLIYIGYDAFAGTAISTIQIPDTVQTIQYGAFRNCAHLQTIVFEGKTPPTGFFASDYPGVTVICAE